MAKFGFKFISLHTRLNSRAKLSFGQLWRQAVVDVFGAFNVDAIKVMIGNADNKTVTSAAKFDKKILRYIMGKQPEKTEGVVNWLTILWLPKIPEFIVTLLGYWLDRMCLDGLPEMQGSQVRGQKLSWPRFLVRGFIRLAMSVPLFVVRALGSPINTLLLPALAFSMRITGSFRWAHAIASAPIVGFGFLAMTVAGALLGGVPLVSMAMFSVVFGATPLMIAINTAFMAIPILLKYSLMLSGFATRPSDALCREVNADHLGYNESAQLSTKRCEDKVLEKLEANPSYGKIMKNLMELKEATDEAVEHKSRRYEFDKSESKPNQATKWERLRVKLADQLEIFKQANDSEYHSSDEESDDANEAAFDSNFDQTSKDVFEYVGRLKFNMPYAF